MGNAPRLRRPHSVIPFGSFTDLAALTHRPFPGWGVLRKRNLNLAEACGGDAASGYRQGLPVG